MRPEDLVAIETIRRLKARYFRLLDTKRWDEWADLFTEDAVMDVTDDTGDRASGTVRGRDAIVATVSAALADARTVHHGHTPEIEIVDDAHATGTWAMEDTVDVAPPGEPPRGIHGTGWYHEEYRCEDGTWRIAAMHLERLRVDPLGPAGAW